MSTQPSGELETPARRPYRLANRTHCPTCDRALADHGLRSLAPIDIRLAPCDHPVGDIPIGVVARALSGDR